MDKKSHVAAVFLDISKAFDSLNHHILLAKLNNIGLRGPAYDLIKSYLTERKQFVFCTNIYSDYKLIEYGVPQGSILDPILFLVYINDIINSTDNVHFTMYADDTSFIVTDNDLQALHFKLSLVLDRISNWVKANKLELNVNKTHVMLFQNRSLSYDLAPVRLDREIVRVHTT